MAGDLQQWLRSRGVPVLVVPEQGRLLAERLPRGHPWSHREQTATALMHQGAEAAAEVILRAEAPAGVLIADGCAATPLVWHMCAVRDRQGYDAGPEQVTEDLLAAVQAALYDLVLLTAPDIPWEADGIRDDPHGRSEAFERYRWLYPDAVVIAGPQRAADARRVVSALLQIPVSGP